MKNTLKIIYFFIPVIISCRSFSLHQEKPHVTLGYNETAYTYSIIIKDEQIPFKILKPGKMPYSDNASGMVWIGKSFPPELAIDFILKSKNYYKELKYIAYFDLNPQIFPDQNNFELYIGAPTKDALKLHLTAWTENDFSALEKVRTRENMNKLIHSHYPPDSDNLKKRNIKNLIKSRSDF